jgi:tetratricopeptide (TPR) repeat protein
MTSPRFTLPFFVLLFLAPAVALQAGFKEELAYAEYLFNRQEYNLALTEYRRVLFLYPAPAAENGVRERIARCYFKSADHAGLRSFILEQGVADQPEFRYLSGLSAFQQGRYALALERLSRADPQAVELMDFSAMVRSASLACLEKYPEALALIETSVSEDSSLFEKRVLLKSAILKLSTTKPKSPALAAGLGLIPGAGLAYTGDWLKAGTLFSAGLITGAAGWLSLQDRNWSRPAGRDILEVVLWGCGALVLIGRSASESYQAAEAWNEQRNNAVKNLMLEDQGFIELFQRFSLAPVQRTVYSLAFSF